MENNQGKSRRPVWEIFSFALLIILFGLGYLVSGKAILEKPTLMVGLLLVWFGLLAGISIASHDG